MNLSLLSDIHVESQPFEAPQTDADVIVLAGDIGEGVSGLYWARRQEAFRGKPILYISGNHEFYGARLERMSVEIRHCATELGIHYLDNSVLDLNGVRFIGATLWTDFALFGEDLASVGKCLHVAQQFIADYSAIIYGTTGFMRPSHSMELHKVSRSFIERSLAAPFDGPKVVITHMAPSVRSIQDKYKEDLTSAAFASRLDHLVEKADLWIHGHVHSHFDYLVGSCRVVCNARGYPGEETHFQPEFTVKL